MSSDKPDSERSRTDLAEDRTILANERTFASWMRTSLGCVGIGVGFHALFSKVDPSWLPKLIATGFLALSAFIAFLATRRAAAVTKRLDPHVIDDARTVNLGLIASAVSLGSLTLAVAIWVLDLD